MGTKGSKQKNSPRAKRGDGRQPILHVVLPEAFSLVKLIVLLAACLYALDGPVIELATVVAGTETSVNIGAISTASLLGNAALGFGLTLTWREKKALGQKLRLAVQA